MSGLAEILRTLEFDVSGSDLRAGENTKNLERLGVRVDIGTQFAHSLLSLTRVRLGVRVDQQPRPIPSHRHLATKQQAFDLLRVASQRTHRKLGEIALDPEVRIGGDTGKPVALRDAEAFVQLANNIVARLAAIGPQTGPKIEISD